MIPLRPRGHAAGRVTGITGTPSELVNAWVEKSIQQIFMDDKGEINEGNAIRAVWAFLWGVWRDGLWGLPE